LEELKMKEQLEERLKELKNEFENGKKVLEELDVKRTNLTQTLLRISGAIQALEDLMPKEEVSN
jgi:predicted nuclease with TOPRIM domain